MTEIILINPNHLAIFLFEVNHKTPETKESIQNTNGITDLIIASVLKILRNLKKLTPPEVT